MRHAEYCSGFSCWWRNRWPLWIALAAILCVTSALAHKPEASISKIEDCDRYAARDRTDCRTCLAGNPKAGKHFHVDVILHVSACH